MVDVEKRAKERNIILLEKEEIYRLTKKERRKALDRKEACRK